MQKIWEVVLHLTGGIYIPEEVRDSSIKIIHISDTPSMIYSDIYRLVKIINPDVLIHTGDLVDDVKLEMLPQQITKYKARANDFLKNVSNHTKDMVVVVPGNHDEPKVLTKQREIKIVEEGKVFEKYNMKLGLAHYFERLPKDCDYYLYGHSKVDHVEDNYLNGIDFINIIKVEEGKVFRLLYPSGTDNYRLRRNKLGI
ncbi:MAG: metallophosphoesterase [Bacillota bacterium]